MLKIPLKSSKNIHSALITKNISTYTQDIFSYKTSTTQSNFCFQNKSTTNFYYLGILQSYCPQVSIRKSKYLLQFIVLAQKNYRTSLPW